MKKNFKLVHPNFTATKTLTVLTIASICLIFALYIELTATYSYAYYPEYCTTCGVVEDAPEYPSKAWATMWCNQVQGTRFDCAIKSY